MTIQQKAEKLGFNYATRKALRQATGGTFYTMTEHTLTQGDKPPFVFRDVAAVNLFLDDRSQLDLLKDAHQKPLKRT